MKGYLPIEMVKIKDLSIEELKCLISDTIRETVEDLIEDMLALSSDEYLKSIEKARKDYKEGRMKPFEEILEKGRVMFYLLV